MKAGPKIARTVKSLAIITLVIYIIFFITNIILQRTLDEKSELRDSYIENIQKRAAIEKKVKDLSKITKLYKDTKARNKNMSESYKDVFKALNDSVESVDRISYDRDVLEYKISCSDPRATSFAYLIMNFLESENVVSVALDFVQYDTGSGKYHASMEIKVK